MDQKVVYVIKNGPSRDTLFDACKYAYDKVSNVPVDFEVHDSTTGTRIKITEWKIVSVSHEDGSGHSFNISGYCKTNVRGYGIMSVDFKAYYNARSREGSIRFHKNL